MDAASASLWPSQLTCSGPNCTGSLWEMDTGLRQTLRPGSQPQLNINIVTMAPAPSFPQTPGTRVRQALSVVLRVPLDSPCLGKRHLQRNTWEHKLRRWVSGGGNCYHER